MSIKGMKILITGVAGFVGAGLARALLQDGAHLHGFVRPTSDLWRISDIKRDLQLHTGDLLDHESVGAAVGSARPDAILHLGVYGAYPAYQKDKARIIATSLLSTMALLDAAKKNDVGVLINTGSSSEYGTKDHPMREDERIPTLISKALANEDVPLVGPNIARDFIYIDDVIDIYRAALARPELSGEVFNAGSGVQRSLQDAFDSVVAETGSSSKALSGAYERRSFDTNLWVADMEKTRHSLESGLRETVKWVMKNRAAGN
jgi:nucleoside-diphosphate-sugar epimerase